MKRLNQMAVALALVSSLVSGFAGCAPDAEEFGLLADDHGERLRQRRRRMNITVDAQGQPQELTPAQFEDEVTADCELAANGLVGEACVAPELGLPSISATCAAATCTSTAALCVANRYLELAAAIQPIQIGAYLVAPQSNATKAGFYERAAYQLQAAIMISGEALRQPYVAASHADGVLPAQSCAAVDLAVEVPNGDPNSRSLGALLTGNLAEATTTLREAVHGAMERNIAEADNERSITPDRVVANQGTWHDPVLSRARAAQLAFGRVEVQDDETIAGYGLPKSCALPLMTGRGGRALEYIRSSGVSPEHIRDTSLSIEGFLDPAVPADGVIERVQQLVDLPDLGAGDAVDLFLAAHALSTADFVEARAHLRCELDAFPRDELEFEDVEVAPMTTVPVYQATSHAPIHSLPGEAWANVLAAEADRDIVVAGVFPWRTDLAMRGAAHALDYARRVSVELTAIENPPAPASAPGILATPTVNFIAAVGAQAAMNTAGRVSACARENAGDQWIDVVLHDDGMAPLGDYLVIAGRSALECLVFGTVAGEACALDYTQERNATLTSSNAEASTGYAREVTFSYIVEGAPAGGIRDFLVLRNPGAADKAPGGYRLIAPVVSAPTLDLTTLSVGEQLCDSVPVGTEYEGDVGAALGSDPEEPSTPETPCERFTGLPVPLEAELNDDGDRYETSWRGQLATATAAAEHADQLGRDYIANGLESDSRAESAQRELEAVCGVSVELNSLFEEDLSNMVGGNCTGPGTCADPSAYECMGGVCVRNLVGQINSHGDTGRTNRILSSCLGEASAVRPIVALGSRPLCVWQRNLDPTLLCERDGVTGPAGPHPCPFQADESGGCVLASGYTATPEHSVVPVSDHLQIFDGEGRDSGGAVVRDDVDCGNAVRRLRDATMTDLERRQLLRELWSSNTVSQREAHRAAERLGWVGYPGDFGALRLNRNEAFATGDPHRSALVAGERFGDTWPCDGGALAPGVECAGAGTTSLLCETWTCSDRAQRSEANFRISRATATLGLIASFGLGNLELPVGTNQDPPSPPSVGANSRSLVLYLDDSSTVGTSMVVSNYAGWPDSGAHEWSGRTYRLASFEPGPAFVWTGRASGNNIDDPPSTDGPDCLMFGICPLDVVQDSARTERDYTFFTYARYSDDELWMHDSEARARDFAAIWAGTAASNSVGTVGPVASALSWAANSARTEQLSLQTADAPLGVIPFGAEWALAEHSALAASPIAYTRINTTEKGNYARLFSEDGITNSDILDALELMCLANSPTAAMELGGCGDAAPPPITGEADVPAARAYLRCLAADMERAAEYAVVQNVPSVVVDAGRGETAIAPLEGEFGRAASGTREALLALRELPRTMATQVRGFEADLSAFEVSMRQGQISREIIDWRLAQESVRAAATCAEISENRGMAGYARCGSALTNLAISFRISDLSRESVSLERQQHLIDLRSRMENRVDALQRINSEINRLTEQLDGHLSAIGVSQRRARRLLAQTMFTASVPGREHLEETPVAAPVNVAMRRRYNTSHERYEQARNRAHSAAVLAMRSVEQRLGMSLERMDRELPLLESTPAELASSLCGFEGLNYEAIRDGGWPGEDGTPRESYASGFIGDYVRDLEAVMDSYPYAYPYTDGTDVAVVSLRDDIARVRSLCPQPSYNLLAGTQELIGPMWHVLNCDLAADPTALCIGYRRLQAADVDTGMGDTQPGPLAAPLPTGASASLAAQGYRFDFGDAVGSGGAVTATTSFEQTIYVAEAGTYRVSWFGRQVGTGPDPLSLVAVSGSVGAASAPFETPAGTEALASGWRRYFQFVDVDSPGEVVVSVVPGASYNTSVDLGGFMFDRTSATESAAAITTPSDNPLLYYPPAFMGADDDGLSLMAACEDTYGDDFRTSGWATRCEFLCPGGFAASCDPGESSVSYCYRERDFILSQEQIALGQAWTEAGFAYGNFNYRIERIGVNVVGRRDCEESGTPTTCFASGTVPYTIVHRGPYNVTNHMGETFEAPLFTSSIDHARGLAAERYITNPISSADRSLIDAYMRDDFNGRPLDGTFQLRLWDAPGVDFTAVEDVQLVIEYRYWNRSRVPSATD